MALCAATLALGGPASADDAEPPDTPHRPVAELWSGAEAYRRAWSVYGGATLALFGSIQEDGWRLRALGGQSTYLYRSQRWTGTGTVPVTLQGTATFADLLVGYHRQLGPLTLKAFAGVSTSDHNLDDPEARVRGRAWGGKGALEAWWNITDLAWVSADLSLATMHRDYASRLRLGWRLLPELSVGLEAGAVGNLDCDIARAGGFLRYAWDGGEASLSGGWASDAIRGGGDGTPGPYAVLSVLTRF